MLAVGRLPINGRQRQQAADWPGCCACTSSAPGQLCYLPQPRHLWVKARCSITAATALFGRSCEKRSAGAVWFTADASTTSRGHPAAVLRREEARGKPIARREKDHSCTQMWSCAMLLQMPNPAASDADVHSYTHGPDNLVLRGETERQCLG